MATASSAPALSTSFSWNTMTPAQALELCRQARGMESLPHSDADGGFHLVARYDDVVQVMDDPATFSSSPTVLRPVSPGVPSFPALEYDPPGHGPWREVYRELVNPRTVKRLAGQVLSDVNAYIDRFIADRADSGVAYTMEDRSIGMRDNAFASILIAEAIDTLLEISGTGAFGETSPVQQAWRDIHFAVAHVSVNKVDVLSRYGRIALGVPEAPGGGGFF